MIEPKNLIQGIEWDDFRNDSQEIQLVPIYEWVYDEKASDNVVRYLTSVQMLRSVKSRQIAAMTIVNARAFELVMNMPY